MFEIAHNDALLISAFQMRLVYEQVDGSSFPIVQLSTPSDVCHNGQRNGWSKSESLQHDL